MKKMLVIVASLMVLFIISFSCSYGVYRKMHDYSDEIISTTEYREDITEVQNEEAAALVKNNTEMLSESEVLGDSDENEEEASDYNFLVGELNGYVAVYTNTGSLYEFTDIKVDLLEDSVKERIKAGIKFQKAKEMFTFLESCSS